MNKYLGSILLFILIIAGSISQGSAATRDKKNTLKVLFVGNSYTYVQNLPQLVSLISDSTQTKLITRKSTVGGAFLSEHWYGKRGLKTQEIISKGHFDAVILQENSMGTIQQPDSTIKYVRLLCALIRQSGAKPYLYMTWARERVPQYQDEITQVYTEMAKMNEAVLVPVGEAWELSRKLRPTLELYNRDGSHPSNLGALLSAYVFVGVLTGEVPAKIPEWYQIKDLDGETVELTNIDALDAVFFRKVVEKILSDKN